MSLPNAGTRTGKADLMYRTSRQRLSIVDMWDFLLLFAHPASATCVISDILFKFGFRLPGYLHLSFGRDPVKREILLHVFFRRYNYTRGDGQLSIREECDAKRKNEKPNTEVRWLLFLSSATDNLSNTPSMNTYLNGAAVTPEEAEMTFRSRVEKETTVRCRMMARLVSHHGRSFFAWKKFQKCSYFLYTRHGEQRGRRESVLLALDLLSTLTSVRSLKKT